LTDKEFDLGLDELDMARLMPGPRPREEVDSVRRSNEGPLAVGVWLISVSFGLSKGIVAARGIRRGGGVAGEGK
jgi:hypothetical protein